MNLYQNVSAHRKETFENEEIKIGLECGALEYDSKADSIRRKKEMATSVVYNSSWRPSRETKINEYEVRIMDENEKRRLFNLLYKGQGDSRTIGLLLINELEGENKKLDESLINATKQNLERQEIIDNLKKEHEEQNEILNQIKNICELALNRKENWSKEQLEELIQQIKKRT